MMDFFFFLKTFMLTLMVVLLLQIDIGGKTVETHMHDMIAHSLASGFVDNAAHGGAHALKDFTHNISEKMKQNIGLKHKHEQAERKASLFHWGWSSNADKSSANDQNSNQDDAN